MLAPESEGATGGQDRPPRSREHCKYWWVYSQCVWLPWELIGPQLELESTENLHRSGSYGVGCVLTEPLPGSEGGVSFFLNSYFRHVLLTFVRGTITGVTFSLNIRAAGRDERSWESSVGPRQRRDSSRTLVGPRFPTNARPPIPRNSIAPAFIRQA